MSPVFDATKCILGEGPLWHPEREALFWCDIKGMKLHAKGAGGQREWAFDHHVSAIGWVDRDTLLIASEVALHRFDIESGTRETLVALEADNPVTRSNDGRADPYGGFWIGTMGKSAEAKAGAIYRYYKGELRKLFGDITVSNAICFSPDRAHGYFTDTDTGIVQRVALDEAGWPAAAPEPFIDLTEEGLRPDGAVTDTDGNLWIAQWGAGRIAVHAADGTFLRALPFPAIRTTCPAWGGPDYRTLYCTSANIDDDSAAAGQTFVVEDAGQGRPEPRVIL